MAVDDGVVVMDGVRRRQPWQRWFSPRQQLYGLYLKPRLYITLEVAMFISSLLSRGSTQTARLKGRV
ncbi:hypothetical protein EUGRSUZ_G00663 [Eucalyptus grandis]|uniref:Uncharacterized protein n=2 Tax=Eucalyptus grandis TaxID=71139 RepID=A0ACC3K123_EUCGR|nr:hypothetical protein EUGRSUZ_G00663 [Eucalyptus grandis]